MISVEGWLPIGSVVHINNSDKLVFVAGCMQRDGSDGTVWDYFGYPYPEGNYGENSGVLFNKDSIDQVIYLGFQDVDGLRWEETLAAAQGQFDELRAEHAVSPDVEASRPVSTTKPEDAE